MLSRSAFLVGLPAVAVMALAPCPARPTTDRDLSGRIVVDGRASEYAADEWVSSSERPGDSRWGSDNDVRRVAVTWDRARLYLAVECVTVDSNLLLFLNHTAGGVRDMVDLGELRRSVVLTGIEPDLLVLARPESEEPDVFRASLDRAVERLGDGAVAGRYAQFAAEGGALELAIPWDLVARSDGVVDLIAAITGAPGTGCGDAAPDPSATPSTVRTDIATLDRFLRVTVDADADGLPDEGVAPRDVSAVVPDDAAPSAGEVALALRPEARAFAPDRGEVLAFSLHREHETEATGVYVSARVYSLTGDVVRVLYEDDRRSLEEASLAQESVDSWDGSDRHGRVVPGGIYVISVSWGVARGSRSGTANAAVAVVR